MKRVIKYIALSYLKWYIKWAPSEKKRLLKNISDLEYLMANKPMPDWTYGLCEVILDESKKLVIKLEENEIKITELFEKEGL